MMLQQAISSKRSISNQILPGFLVQHLDPGWAPGPYSQGTCARLSAFLPFVLGLCWSLNEKRENGWDDTCQPLPFKSIDCLSSQHRSHLSLIRMNRHLLCHWKRSTNSALTRVPILKTFLQSVRACSRLRPKKNTECSNLNEWTIMGD